MLKSCFLLDLRINVINFVLFVTSTFQNKAITRNSSHFFFLESQEEKAWLKLGYCYCTSLKK